MAARNSTNRDEIRRSLDYEQINITSLIAPQYPFGSQHY